ncbi:MAG: DUF2510 domain-containing protein [Actinobacteria bacterium]|nr:DUF2510 domain-containing protein [Actinomycetota bacterium]
MSAPVTAPPGWYRDPSGRYELRYWDGAGWTAHVSNGGVVLTDVSDPALAFPAAVPPPPPAAGLRPAGPAGLADTVAFPWQYGAAAGAGPAVPVPMEKRRRGWLVAVVAGVAALGLIAGLVIWAPWQSAPLLRPAGLAAGPATASSVTLRWAPPATGPAPDRYQVRQDGTVVGSVPGTATSYRAAGLSPATSYRYQVAAIRGGKRSALSVALQLTTVTPPTSAGRLAGAWNVAATIIRGAASLTGGVRSWHDTWVTRPACGSGPCAVTLAGHLNGHLFRAHLHRAGGVYRGRASADVFPCGAGAGSFPIRSTLTFKLTVRAAGPSGPAWMATAWAGTLRVASPYTASGNYYCSPSRQILKVSGH